MKTLCKKFEEFVMILQKFLNLNDTFLPKKLSKTRKFQLNFLIPKKPSKMPKNSAHQRLNFTTHAPKPTILALSKLEFNSFCMHSKKSFILKTPSFEMAALSAVFFTTIMICAPLNS